MEGQADATLFSLDRSFHYDIREYQQELLEEAKSRNVWFVASQTTVLLLASRHEGQVQFAHL